MSYRSIFFTWFVFALSFPNSGSAASRPATRKTVPNRTIKGGIGLRQGYPNPSRPSGEHDQDRTVLSTWRPPQPKRKPGTPTLLQ